MTRAMAVAAKKTSSVGYRHHVADVLGGAFNRRYGWLDGCCVKAKVVGGNGESHGVNFVGFMIVYATVLEEAGLVSLSMRSVVARL